MIYGHKKFLLKWLFILLARNLKSMESIIKLFKALPIEVNKKKTNKGLMKKTIGFGFVFAPEVVANYSNYDELIKLVRETIGMSDKELNNAFHKSWVKIKDANIEDLVVEQLAHYMTTYGKEDPERYLEEKGIEWEVDELSTKVADLKDIEMDKIYDENYVYIPAEKLKIPKIDVKGFPLVVIKGYTKEELKKKILDLLNSGIALNEDTLKNILDVAAFIEIVEKDIQKIKNKEAKSLLYDYLGLFPENPIEFLRFAVYKSSNKTLLIKNKDLIEEIKSKDNFNVLKLFNDYDRKYGIKRLAEIFYRFKPIFLAFRTNKRLKTITNKIRKLAVNYHKPMPEDYLNAITSKLKNGKKLNVKELKEELKKVNVFRKIRLAYALKFRTGNVKSILYRIRNGKGYATNFEFNEQEKAQKILDIVVDSVVEDVAKNVKEKKIYIPEYVNYTLPATEKQFTGYFPSGTCITIPKDMVFGIHWKNVRNNVIDLDLSLISLKTGKVGWDSYYRTENKNVLFSGDITDAKKPCGATELFYVQRQAKNVMILFVNYYNFEDKREVPFKILVAKEQVKDFRENYMVNPNNVVAIANSKINKKQKMIGLVATANNETKFYFAETNIGRSITSSESEFAEHSRKYLFEFYKNAISLREILEKAGAQLVKQKEKAEIDLSPENIEKDTILKFLI